MVTIEHLWDTYSHDLQKFIASRVDWPAADDILQQVFLKVHSKITTLEDPNKVKQRLYRIAQHSIIDRYRKERSSDISNMDEGFWQWVEEDRNTNQSILAKNISSCLLPMIENLWDKEKNIMQQYLDWVSQKEIAAKTWDSIANIKVIIHRIKKKLQEKYTQCCYQYRDDSWVLIDIRCSKNCGCDNTPLQF
jgi:RNA polymerase sigma-70 factor, ECF subfamily